MSEVVGRNARRKSRSDGITYQRPLSLSPWAMNAGVEKVANSTVWVIMTPSRITDQFSKGAGTIASVPLNTEFKFLAPLSLNENIVHHWEQYESVASRVAQKVRSAVKLGAEGAALAGLFDKKANIADTLKDTFSNQGGNVGTAIENAVVNTYRAIGGSRRSSES